MSKMKTGTDLQEQVQRAIDEMVESGTERGLQVRELRPSRPP